MPDPLATTDGARAWDKYGMSPDEKQATLNSLYLPPAQAREA